MDINNASTSLKACGLVMHNDKYVRNGKYDMYDKNAMISMIDKNAMC
jgi:hypothetical protein